MFEKFTITTMLEAATPIAHHSEAFGNVAILMTEPVIQPSGSKSNVPIITGDTMRHALRESAAMAFLDAAGLLDEPSLSEAACRLLFSGGTLNGPSGSAISISEYRALVDLVPSLALLGGCAGNRMQPGRMQVGRALLLCKESMVLLRHSPWVVAWVDASEFDPPLARASIDQVQRVRMDPTLSPTSRSMLSASAAQSAGDRVLAREAAGEADDPVAIQASKSSMMPRTFEVVAAGSRFVWDVTVELHSELDRDTFDLMYSACISHLVVGGKRGTGHGHLAPLQANKVVLSRPADPGSLYPVTHTPVGSAFREHIHARRDQIRDFLAKVEA